MTALAADRNTKQNGSGFSYEIPAAVDIIYAGSLVAINATGYAAPAADTEGFKVVGMAMDRYDNSAGSAGDISAQVMEGVFEFVHAGTFAQGSVGEAAYVVDDQTVAASGTVFAGIVVEYVSATAVKIVCGLSVSAADAVGTGTTASIETVTSGALDPDVPVTLLSVTGTQAYTIANGTFDGQRKIVICTVAATTPKGTLTPATYADGTNELFLSVGDSLALEYHETGGWRKINQHRVENGIETATSGALSLEHRTTLLSCTGTQAYTLADGVIEGQRKSIICTVAASTPVGTLTPTTYADGTTETFLNVGDQLELEWHASGGWRKVQQERGLGTEETVTSGALALDKDVHLMSVTGTQAYTLADGLYTGQKKYLRCTVAATTPDGTLTPTTLADGSTIGFDAVDEQCILVWGASGWRVVNIAGATVA